MTHATITACFAMLRAAISTIHGILFPPFCAYCKRYLDQAMILCEACVARVTPVASIELMITATKRVKLFAVSRYADPLQSLVLAKSSSSRIAAIQLGELMWKMSAVAHADFDYIVPIPLHWTRYAYRGYNQAEEMAKIIAQRSGKPMINALVRRRKTPFQSLLPHNQRSYNIKDAFVIDSNKTAQFQGKKILIVDDVMTSGNTIKEAARILYVCKPEVVIAVVACRTI